MNRQVYSKCNACTGVVKVLMYSLKHENKLALYNMFSVAKRYIWYNMYVYIPTYIYLNKMCYYSNLLRSV